MTLPSLIKDHKALKHRLDSTDFKDVSLTSLTTYDILAFDGTDWINTSTPTFDSATIGSIEIPTIYNDALDPTGFTNRTDSTLSFSDGDYTFTITGTHYIYIHGVKYTKETASIQLTNSTGIHWIYYDNNGDLAESTDTDGPGFQFVLIATIYYNTDVSMDKGLLGDERHGHKMDFITHGYLHNSVGTRYVSGLAGTFIDATFDTELGVIYDEDIAHNIGAQTTCDVLYKDGSADYKWLENQTKYYFEDGGSDINYNNGNTLTAMDSNKYVAYWIFATNSIDRPIVSLMGQRQDTTLASARTNNTYESLTLGTLPFKEMKVLYRVILRNDATPYEETQDLRSVSNLPAGTYIATSHLVLSDLATGDAGHTQLALLAGRTGGQELFGSDTTAEDLTLTDNSVDNNSITVTEAISAFTHVSNDGSDHSFIDQSVVSGANVAFGTIGSGAITSSGIVQGTSITDGTGTLSSGALSGITTIAHTRGLTQTSGAPQIVWVETGVTADNTTWRINVNNEIMNFQVLPDDLSTSNDFIDIRRTAQTIDSINLTATTTNINGNLQVKTNSEPIIWLRKSATGLSALTRTMGGLQLSTRAMGSGTAFYGAGIKFMSTDPQFTTENPKFLAAIIPRSTEAYNADTDGGMGIDFFTTPNNPGTTNIPLLAMRLTETQGVKVTGDLSIANNKELLLLTAAGADDGTGLKRTTANGTTFAYTRNALIFQAIDNKEVKYWDSVGATYVTYKPLTHTVEIDGTLNIIDDLTVGGEVLGNLTFNNTNGNYVTRGTYIKSATIDYDTSGLSSAITIVDDGYMVTQVYAEVTEVWDGTGTVTIGDDDDADGYLTWADMGSGSSTGYKGLTISERGDYLDEIGGVKAYSSSKIITATVTQGTSTQGSMEVYVVIQKIK